MASFDIVPRDDFSIAEIDQLEENLYENNRRITGHGDGRRLAFVARDAQGGQIGAVAGYSWAGMAEIRQLWVDAPHRGQGLGRGLLDAAVAEAKARGCQIVWVMSHSFQAPGLYERAGFHRVAELVDFPPDHSQVILQRRLVG